ncbi:FliQ Flagellar biosynthesis pathway, component FliQ [Burkholderiaceae bacterium]|jgi:flagellar biosynthetic protein FliQ
MLDSALVVDLGRQALWMTMLISAPILGIGLVVGLTVGVFQAATSINEQTLSFIPKLVAMGVTLALAGGWMINTMVDYTRVLFGRIPTLFG